METIHSYTTIEQSRKLVEILSLESADMYYEEVCNLPKIIIGNYILHNQCMEDKDYKKLSNPVLSPAWSLAALLDIFPEINGIPLTLEKVKAEDGYEGYYYHIEYKDIVLIPYSKNPVDACIAMIEKLNELNLL